jgi:phenylacetate-CoA ligase
MMKTTPLDDWVSLTLGSEGRLSIAQLRDYQLGKLRTTLEYVISHSRFYKNHLREIDAAAIRSVDGLSQVPFTHPEMLAENFNDFLCASPRDISRIVTLSTSGTTGRPKRIAFTPEDQESTVDFFHHGMKTFADSSDRVIIFLPGYAEGSVGRLLSKAVSRIGCESKIFGPIKNPEQALKVLVDEKITCAVGIPTQMLALSRYAGSASPAIRIQLKSVLLSTDYLPRAIADSLAQVWGCDVYDHYGMTEMGLGGAVECSAHAGYHMREPDLLFEIVDPVTGQPVEDGEYGEVVFTTLTRQGMPLIRYRTGDRSRFINQLCSCGSVLRRMDRISGRIRGGVRLDGGLSISVEQLDEIVFQYPGISEYSAEMHNRDGCDCLVLTMRPAKKAFDGRQIARKLGRLPIEDLIKRKRLKLDIREGDTGFFTAGTAKRSIVDRR